MRHFFDAKKPIAVICHGPWTLVEADVKGVEMTSWPSHKTDLKNAGANRVDKDVVVDQGIVSDREPDDLPAFCQKLVEEFKDGRRRQRHAAEQIRPRRASRGVSENVGARESGGNARRSRSLS